MRKMFLLFTTVFVLSVAAPAQIVVAQAGMSDGQVQGIDENAGSITLRHDPVKNLDMDMVYPVRDPSLLKGLKVGDKVKFQMERVNGQLTVTKLHK